MPLNITLCCAKLHWTVTKSAHQYSRPWCTFFVGLTCYAHGTVPKKEQMFTEVSSKNIHTRMCLNSKLEHLQTWWELKRSSNVWRVWIVVAPEVPRRGLCCICGSLLSELNIQRICSGRDYFFLEFSKPMCGFLSCCVFGNIPVLFQATKIYMCDVPENW